MTITATAAAQLIVLGLAGLMSRADAAVPALTPAAAAFKTASSAATRLPHAADLGTSIEGASVTGSGRPHALNATHLIDLVTGDVLFKGSSSVNHFSSARFTRTRGLLVGDAVGHQIFSIPLNSTTKQPIEASASKPIIGPNPSFLQPNDMAINRAETHLYTSGQNWTSTTVAGRDGELWFHDLTTTTKSTRIDLAPLGIHRTNGIELSPNDDTLYLSSAANVNGNVVSSAIYRFDISPTDGMPVNPRKIIDLSETARSIGLVGYDGIMDPDGMRCDVRGRLYITLNAYQRVLRWDPNVDVGASSSPFTVINLPTVSAPSNLEIAHGRRLFVIGQCAGWTASCVDDIRVDDEGRAMSNLKQ